MMDIRDDDRAAGRVGGTKKINGETRADTAEAEVARLTAEANALKEKDLKLFLDGASHGEDRR